MSPLTKMCVLPRLAVPLYHIREILGPDPEWRSALRRFVPCLWKEN
jgi:hypothetical protein